MPKGCKYIYNNKTYTREEFMSLLAGGEYRNILASAEQPIKVKLSRGSKEFVETTKQVANEVKSKVVPGKRHSTWINNKTKDSFETDISLDEVKQRTPKTYVNSIYTIASVVGGNDVIDSFEKLATNLSKQEQKDIINTALSMYNDNIKKIQKEKGKVQKRIDALIKRQDKLKQKGQELDEEDTDNLLSDKTSLEVYGKMLSNKKLSSNDISSLVDFIKTIPSLGVKAQIMSEIIHHCVDKSNYKPWYLIGVDKTGSTTMNHEIAHGLYYTNMKYKSEMDNLIGNIEPKIYNQFKKSLIKLGYANDKVIIDDEIQSYMSTGKLLSWNNKDYEKYTKDFVKVFKKYNKKNV